MTRQADHARPAGAPLCGHCGSANVLRDAWAFWDPDTGSWRLGALFDHVICDDCEAETHLVWPGDRPPDAEAERS